MPGFPSYCADSLLMITSSITCCRCSCIGHHVFLHTRPNSRPNQVHLRYVPSTSYRFLQTPSLVDDALANRILFPMNRVRPLAIASGGVCQLRWANKKSSAAAGAAELFRFANVNPARVVFANDLRPLSGVPGRVASPIDSGGGNRGGRKRLIASGWPEGSGERPAAGRPFLGRRPFDRPRG